MATKNTPLRGVEASIEGAKHHEIENLNPELEEHLNLVEEEKESGVARNLDGDAVCNKDCGSGRYCFKSCSKQDNGEWKCQQKRTKCRVEGATGAEPVLSIGFATSVQD